MDALLNWIGTKAAGFAGSVMGFILSLFGDMRLTGLNQAVEGISKYIRAACYFLPMDTIGTILGLIIALWNARLVLRAIRTVWELLPIV